MEVLENYPALRSWRTALASKEALSLVPTMGALHRGHRSLFQAAAATGGTLLASLFVNPLQFERSDDLQAYPRTLEADLELLEELGVAAVYMPAVEDIVPSNFQVSIDPGPVATRFEGAARPGHFAGMLTIVHKLLQRSCAQHAWFGEKDAQQLFLVRRMVEDLDMGVSIHACPTFRESDGLAFSSRNAHLDATARPQACVLSRALRAAEQSYEQGCRDPRQLEACMTLCFQDSPAQLAYAAVVSDHNFDSVCVEDRVDGSWRAIVAARLAGVHLLDNIALGNR